MGMTMALFSGSVVCLALFVVAGVRAHQNFERALRDLQDLRDFRVGLSPD